MVTLLMAEAAVALKAGPQVASLQPILSGSSSNMVRYCYEGGTLKRDGRLVSVSEDATGAEVMRALEEDGADLAHYAPRVYAPDLEGWAPLLDDTRCLLYTSPSPRDS